MRLWVAILTDSERALSVSWTERPISSTFVHLQVVENGGKEKNLQAQVAYRDCFSAERGNLTVIPRPHQPPLEVWMMTPPQPAAQALFGSIAQTLNRWANVGVACLAQD